MSESTPFDGRNEMTREADYIYTLSVPSAVHDELKRICDMRGLSHKELMQKMVTLFAVCTAIEDTPGEQLAIISEGTPPRILSLFGGGQP